MADFDPSGQVRIYLLDAAPAGAAYTVAEIGAGTRLDCQVMRDGVAGFSTDQSTIDSTPLCALTQEKLNSISNLTDGSLTIKRGNDAADVFAVLMDTLTALAQDPGFVLFLLSGDAPAAGDIYDSWPVVYGGVQPQPLVGGQVARYMLPCTVNGQATLNEQVLA